MPEPERSKTDLEAAGIGACLQPRDLLPLGDSLRQLQRLVQGGTVEKTGSGFHRLASLEPLVHPNLVAVAQRVPQGVLCLLSALGFHELTTQVPQDIDVALERGMRKPRLDHPPTRFF
ncbi:MAG: hypothetical protein IPN34_00135 [Planctomycetes bacterium]|nr:hypothetical protein [Planctomycetota bacterium]